MASDEVKQLLDQGAQLFKEGKLDEAITKLKAAVDADPSSVQAHSYLGAAYARDGQGPASVEQFQAAVDLDPTSAVHTFNLGQAFETAGSKPRAKALYEKALALDPKYARAQQRLDALSGKPAASAAPAAAPTAPPAQPAAQTTSMPSAPPAGAPRPMAPPAAPPGGPQQYGGSPQYGPQYGSPVQSKYDPALGLGRSAATSGGYAPSWKRFVAALLDGFILSAIYGVTMLAFKPAIPAVTPSPAGPSPQAISALVDSIRSMQLVWSIVAALYFVGFHSVRGQTLGKMALRIKVVKTNGSNIGVGTALGRFIVQEILSGITCGLAYIAILVNSQNRGLHDQAVDTMVVEV